MFFIGFFLSENQDCLQKACTQVAGAMTESKLGETSTRPAYEVLSVSRDSSYQKIKIGKLALKDLGVSRSIANESRKASIALSPGKEDRYYTARGSGAFDDASKALFVNPKEESKKVVWPRLLIPLSSKEKEEDFMAMKGCKPPQRPKKRAKLVQRTILLVSPGSWLSDLCQERYEVREKKTSKKKARGLKGMGVVSLVE